VQIDFDFIDHALEVASSSGARRVVPLEPMSVAEFYEQTMAALAEVGSPVAIWPVPVEMPERTPFPENRHNASYDAAAVERFWRALLQADRLLKQFRAGFTGKASPVAFYWGSFDLAVSFFSGRAAPPHPGAPNVARYVMREAYSGEQSSLGWWPGSGSMTEPAFYAYAYPEPAGYREASVAPEAAYYSQELGEFLLPYEAARTAADPDAAVLAFVESAHAAAVRLQEWDENPVRLLGS
jgi:hypothetical protein